MFDGSLSVVASYILGFNNAARCLEFGIMEVIDRPCATAAESMADAAEYAGLSGTARDQHKYHTDRVVDSLLKNPPRRRREP